MATEASRRTPAQLSWYLDDILFPCSRKEILRCAEDNDAPEILLDAIETLPERYYWSVREIVSHVTGSA